MAQVEVSQVVASQVVAQAETPVVQHSKALALKNNSNNKVAKAKANKAETHLVVKAKAAKAKVNKVAIHSVVKVKVKANNKVENKAKANNLAAKNKVIHSVVAIIHSVVMINLVANKVAVNNNKPLLQNH